MPRRVNLDFGDFETYISNISSECAEKAAEEITTSLKIKGPYWTGEFEGAWEVTLGKDIPASQPRQDTRSQKEIIEDGPQTRQLTRLKAGVDFPSMPKQVTSKYTIGNRMEYRDIALDLEPGRIKAGGNETADQDWYETYTRAGGLATTLALATGKVSKDPKIKNYKGNLNR